MTHTITHILSYGRRWRYEIQRLEFRRYKHVIIAALLLFIINTIEAQNPDTTQHTTLNEVVISDSKAPSEAKSIAPTQVVGSDEIAHIGAVQLSDAMKHFAGITLKDYGGIGGMKTVSARGLGSQFSTLTIDGVAMSDAQNGQIDLGRYCLGNSAYISFANGQNDNLLQTAKAFAAGNVVNMETRQPTFFLTEKTNIKIGLEGGSFGTFSPSLQWEQKINEKVSLSLFANYLCSKGDYPFTVYYTNNHSDSSSIEQRKHSEMWMLTTDINLFYNISNRQHLTVKAHLMMGHYNLPGPVIYYTQKASEESASNIAFAQAKYQWIARNKKWELLTVGKFQITDDTYTDTLSHLHNNYLQNEGYLSANLLFHATPHLDFSFANDGALNRLNSNSATDGTVTRWTTFHVIATNAHWDRISLNGNILFSNSTEQSNSGTEHQWHKLSPYAGISFLALSRSDSLLRHSHTLRLRYFVKENYRIPNFSELYFSEFHSDLRPEKALQQNLGITYNIFKEQLFCFNNVEALVCIDGYYNRVTDKIVAIPTRSMYLWTMTNMDRADIAGIDLKGNFGFGIGACKIDISATYTYQYAVDRTDPESKTFNHQIAYTPRHSGTASVYIENPYLDFGYNASFVGTRYNKNQNLPQNEMPAYVDQGIVVAHTFNLKFGKLELRGQILNIFDVEYEIVKNYPMMGRNFRISLIYEL